MGKNAKRVLLDRLLGEGWFESEREALPWVMERKVLVGDRPVYSLKEKVSSEAEIRIREYYKKYYAGKGGLKLDHALSVFPVDVRGKVALDCGASTGGFTGCLIQRGAARVYAVDAGFGQLAGRLAQDSRVVNMERTNLSDPVLLELEPKPELITLDLSYLSLRRAAPICWEILRGSGVLVALVKPIYEIEDAEVRRSGEMYEPALLTETLHALCAFFVGDGWEILGFTHSPVRGNGGALEYFVCLSCGGGAENGIGGHYAEAVGRAVERSFALEKFKK